MAISYAGQSIAVANSQKLWWLLSSAHSEMSWGEQRCGWIRPNFLLLILIDVLEQRIRSLYYRGQQFLKIANALMPPDAFTLVALNRILTTSPPCFSDDYGSGASQLKDGDRKRTVRAPLIRSQNAPMRTQAIFAANTGQCHCTIATPKTVHQCDSTGATH